MKNDNLACMSQQKDAYSNRLTLVVMDQDKRVIGSRTYNLYLEDPDYHNNYDQIVKEISKEFDCEVYIEDYDGRYFQPYFQFKESFKTKIFSDLMPQPDLPYNEHGVNLVPIYVHIRPCEELLEELKTYKWKKEYQ